MKNLALDSFFKEFLDGKIAAVSCGNVDVSASMEGDVTLQYDKNFGLTCLTTLQWNQNKVIRELFKVVTFREVDPDKLEKVQNNITEVINTFQIRIGQITAYNCKEYRVEMEGENVRMVYLTYKDGSITKIRVNRNQNNN